jgi:hypothetical protein
MAGLAQVLFLVLVLLSQTQQRQTQFVVQGQSYLALTALPPAFHYDLCWIEDLYSRIFGLRNIEVRTDSAGAAV